MFCLFSGTTGNLVTNPRAYSVGCRPPSLLTGSSSSVSTTGSGSSHHHSRHKSRFIDIPGATTASGTSGTGTGSQASSFRCVSKVVKFSFYEKTTKFWCILPLKGQLISKENCQAEDSSKKRTNEFVFTSVRRFLEESSAGKKRFEII